MKYVEMVESIQFDLRELDKILNMCEIYYETVKQDEEIFLKAHELSVLTEGKNDEKDDFLEKAKKVIQTITEKISEFVDGIIQSIKHFFMKAAVKIIIGKCKGFKTNKKIKYKDPKNKIRIGEAALDKLNALIAKISHGTLVQKREVHTVLGNYKIEKQNLRNAPDTEINLETATNLLYKYVSKTESLKDKTNDLKGYRRAVDNIEKKKVPALKEMADTAVEATKAASRIITELTSAITSAIQEIFEGICSIVGVNKDTPKMDLDVKQKNITIKETSNDEETSNEDIDQIYESIYKDIVFDTEEEISSIQKECADDEIRLIHEELFTENFNQSYNSDETHVAEEPRITRVQDFNDPFFRKLFLMHEAYKRLEAEDEFLLLAEGADNTKNSNINGVINGFGQAMESLISMVTGFIDKISKSVRKDPIAGNEEKARRAYREACKYDPELKNKKVEVQDASGLEKLFQSVSSEIEAADKALQAGKDIDVASLISSLQERVKKANNVVTKTILVEEMLNISSYNVNIAKMVSAKLESDKEMLESLKDSFGEKEVNRIRKDIKSYEKRGFLARGKLWLEQRIFSDIWEAIASPAKGYKDLISGTPSPDAKRILNTAMKTKEGREIVDKAVQQGLGMANKAGVSIVNPKGMVSNAKNAVASAVHLDQRKGAIGLAYDNKKKENERIRKREAKNDFTRSNLTSLAAHEIDRLNNR